MSNSSSVPLPRYLGSTDHSSNRYTTLLDDISRLYVSTRASLFRTRALPSSRAPASYQPSRRAPDAAHGILHADEMVRGNCSLPSSLASISQNHDDVDGFVVPGGTREVVPSRQEPHANIHTPHTDHAHI